MVKDRIDDQYFEEHQAAGNGLLDRRLFLKKGLQFGAISSLAASSSLVSASATKESLAEVNPADPPWMHVPGKPFSTYGMPSKFEDDVVRFPTQNGAVPGNGVSWTPLHKMEGTITPNGLHYERHHNGVPQIDPKNIAC